MKAVAVGDLFIPTDKMKGLFFVEGVREKVDIVETVTFDSKNRDDIRRKIRNIEANGPEAEPPPAHLFEMVQDTDILAVHLCPLSRSLIEHAKSLKVICTARGGTENIDMKAVNGRRIPVINTPHHNANAVAEYVVGLMIAETRNIARSHHALKKGEWREAYGNSAHIPELAGSKIGIVGFGQTGRLVAEKLKSFGVETTVCDPFVDEKTIREAGFRCGDLGTVLTESDIVSIHVRLAENTRGMIGENELRGMKPSAYLINTARAGLVDLGALVRALTEGWIQGAAVDVFEKEPAPADHPLFSLDNVTVTNHRAGDTLNAYWKAPLLLGEQLAKFIAGERPAFLANPHFFR
ncbi:MAG: 2-hydroxyacid dehydrogenase [Spirochaetes bacterium]|nr:2-hydroxyacid dehydrogenase [Spirochaetota bacterium]